ncbi:MAG TPA: hypothetical protein VFB66_28540 [Tepidisphaeraceae bacterium]|nr:hypothetical protein [Tepidisphaeraceae bacterium]
MKLPAMILLVTVVATGPVVAAKGSAEAPHVTVNYDGIPDGHARAIAETLSAARHVYAEAFGFDMPEMITCTVECGAGKGSRLYTDGNDRVFLSLPSADRLARPGKSGVFVLYGMCHEVGHVAMYRPLKGRDWMTTAAAEGWAHYAGSVVVDEVFKAKGQKLWTIDPYDYRQDGTARLDAQLKDKSRQDETTLGAGKWRELDAIIGRKGFRTLFEAWQGADVSPTKEGAQALLSAAKSAFPDKADALEKWWGGAAPLFYKATEASGFAKAEIPRNRLEGRPLAIIYDDNGADGKKSIAGGGHATKFRAPGGGEWYLTAVSVHGARYGAPRPPVGATFDVALCDHEMRPVATWKQSYTLFPRGQEKLVRIEVPPTRVPPGEDGFYVCLNFRPTASQGVYVSLDDSTGGKGESQAATPGQPGNPLPNGDWMIRAELDRPKAADALGGAAQKAAPAAKPGGR